MSAPAAAHPAPAGRAVTPPALWFGLFGAPVAWSLQLLASYALVAHGCYPDAEPMATPVVPGLRTLVLGTGAAALAVALLAGGSAWRGWRATQHSDDGGQDAPLEAGVGRRRFMALAGMLLSAVMNVVPLLMLRPCG